MVDEDTQIHTSTVLSYPCTSHDLNSLKIYNLLFQFFAVHFQSPHCRMRLQQLHDEALHEQKVNYLAALEHTNDASFTLHKPRCGGGLNESL